MSKIENGEAVIIILQNPREKIFGILREISAAGIFVGGLDLEYFEEWTRAIVGGEPSLPLTDNFIPMWRVEKISHDEHTEMLPSLTEQFGNRTGFSFSDF